MNTGEKLRVESCAQNCQHGKLLALVALSKIDLPSPWMFGLDLHSLQYPLTIGAGPVQMFDRDACFPHSCMI